MFRLRNLLIVASIAYLFTGVAQVEPEERAVVRRFGRVVATPGPGLWIGLPWGIDRIDRERVRIVRQLAVGGTEGDAGQYLTGDQNLLNARLVVEYAVDPTALPAYVAQKEQVEPALRRETEALAAEWFASQSVDRALAGRAQLAQWLNERLPLRLAPQNLGLSLERIAVESLAAPEEVREAFEAVNQSQTTIRTRTNQASQEAERQANEANTAKFRRAAEAEAYRNERITSAKAEAAAFAERLAQYQRHRDNPDWLATVWREEVGKLLALVAQRGRIEVLDDYLGPSGLELHQFLPEKKR
jgi:membrane protease subunit HflK